MNDLHLEVANHVQQTPFTHLFEKQVIQNEKLFRFCSHK